MCKDVGFRDELQFCIEACFGTKPGLFVSLDQKQTDRALAKKNRCLASGDISYWLKWCT